MTSVEKRHDLLVNACLTLADGHAERMAALHMIEPRADRPLATTPDADKAYDTEDVVNELRATKAAVLGAEHERPKLGDSTEARRGTTKALPGMK
jgi:hypothetical protein